MKKIVFFGSGWYTIPVMEKLLPHGLDLVVTTEKDPTSPFLKYCSEKNINTHSVSRASEIINHQSLIINHSIAVLASFGALIPSSIIDHLPSGIINIHPSLLPKYKGPSPIQYALLNGDEVTGVTLIKLDDQIDHGPILSQRLYSLKGNETSVDLLSILFEIGAEMVEEIIIKIENNEAVTETPQDHSKESWSKKIEKKDGFIDVSNLSAISYKLSAMINAFFPWPGVWFRYSPSSVIPGSDQGSSSIVIASEESKLDNKIIKLLPEDRIQVEGKNPMSLKDFLNGYGQEGKELLSQLNLI